MHACIKNKDLNPGLNLAPAPNFQLRFKFSVSQASIVIIVPSKLF